MFGFIGDIVKVVAAPIQIAAEVTRVVTKPLADAAQEVVQDVKESLDND